MTTTLEFPNPVKAKEFFEDKISFTTGPVEVDRMIKEHEDILVVDVRAEEDYARGHVPGAVNLPRERWGMPVGLDREKINIVYCYSHVCHLAAHAALELARQGFPVMEMEGGFEEWQSHDLPIEKESSEDTPEF